MILNEQGIKMFLDQHNYDIRIHNNARWIDQKCTPDVLTVVADCILDYINEEENTFTIRDIWNTKFSEETIVSVFNKPSPQNKNAENEYDKFFSQPIKMFAYAGILKESKVGRTNHYEIIDVNILKYIAIRERNAIVFLDNYIYKVLNHSDIFIYFEDFFQNQTNTNFNRLKDMFIKFTIDNTRINKDTEARRIFTKVINPLSFTRRKHGTSRGRLSKDIISLYSLMYNQDNFRDLNVKKPKNQTRNEFNVNSQSRNTSRFTIYQIEKAKRNVRYFNDIYNNSRSEVFDQNHQGDIASHRHHIFMQSEFPEISHYEENIISLTPTQHLNYAHKNGDTTVIDTNYQHQCLISKMDTIKYNYELDLDYYSFDNFITVLSTGHDDESYEEVNFGSYDNLLYKINEYYTRF